MTRIDDSNADTTPRLHRGRLQWIALAALVATGLTGACGGSGTTTATPDVWASVDDRSIRRDEVEKAYRGLVQPRATPPSDEEAVAIKLRIVDELVTQDLLNARARTLAVEATETELENAFAERKRGVSDDEFQKQLAQLGITADDIKRALRRELSVQKVIDRDVVSKITITDQDIAAFYNQNRNRFNLTETQHRVAQIVVTPGKEAQLRNRMNDDATTPVEARRKVNILMDRLRAGTTFAELALDYSEDPQTAEQGGDIGFVPESALKNSAPQLREAVLKTETGKVSTVTIGNAYTILMVVAREPAGQRELSDPTVRDGIRDLLRDGKAEVMRTAYLTAIRNDARIVNHLARMVVDGQGRVPGTPPTPAPPAK